MQQEYSLRVLGWSAWLPGIDHCQGWQGWSPDLGRSAYTDLPDVSFIKPMVRRRLSKVSKIALYVAHHCFTGKQGQAVGAGVFCSRHGECVRALSIYQSISESGLVSPTQFSQSVHNAAAGIFSIENQQTIPFTTVAAGAATSELGYVEVWAQIQSGSGPVLMVMADEHLGEPFSRQALTPEFPFGLALILSGQGDGPCLTLARENEESEPRGGVDNLLATLTGLDTLRLCSSNGWRWSLHG